LNFIFVLFVNFVVNLTVLDHHEVHEEHEGNALLKSLSHEYGAPSAPLFFGLKGFETASTR